MGTYEALILKSEAKKFPNVRFNFRLLPEAQNASG